MFVPLRVKSDYSLGLGTASVEELIEAAAALGYRTLGLADLENLYGKTRFITNAARPQSARSPDLSSAPVSLFAGVEKAYTARPSPPAW